MCGARAQGEPWTEGVENKPLLTAPLMPETDPQNPPYWTLDTTTDERVQHRRDGTEICRAPTRRRHQDA